MSNKLKQFLDNKSDDRIVYNMLPWHIKGGTRTMIRISDGNGKHLRTKVKYAGYCGYMMIRNFCIHYKKNGGKFNQYIEDLLIY